MISIFGTKQAYGVSIVLAASHYIFDADPKSAQNQLKWL